MTGNRVAFIGLQIGLAVLLFQVKTMADINQEEIAVRTAINRFYEFECSTRLNQPEYANKSQWQFWKSSLTPRLYEMLVKVDRLDAELAKIEQNRKPFLGEGAGFTPWREKGLTFEIKTVTISPRFPNSARAAVGFLINSREPTKQYALILSKYKGRWLIANVAYGDGTSQYYELTKYLRENQSEIMTDLDKKFIDFWEKTLSQSKTKFGSIGIDDFPYMKNIFAHIDGNQPEEPLKIDNLELYQTARNYRVVFNESSTGQKTLTFWRSSDNEYYIRREGGCLTYEDSLFGPFKFDQEWILPAKR